MAMPEAAVNKNDPLLTLVREVRATRECRGVSPAPSAQAVDGAAHSDLDVRAFAAHGLHHLSALRVRNDVVAQVAPPRGIGSSDLDQEKTAYDYGVGSTNVVPDRSSERSLARCFSNIATLWRHMSCGPATRSNVA